jgi:membrane protein YdbS with pleckstrin-like domain
MGYINTLMADDERILLQRREHWTTLIDLLVRFVRNVMGGGLVAALLDLVKGTGMFTDLVDFLPMGAVRAAMHPVPDWIPAWLPMGVLLTVAGVSGLGLVRGMLGWVSNRNVVTTKRVMSVRGTMSKRSVDSALDRVNDVDTTQGWIGRLFGYGSVAIYTGNGQGSNYIKRVADPAGFKRALLNAKQDNATIISAKQLAGAAALAPDVAGRINRLNNLYKEGLLSTDEYVAKRKSMIEEL